MIHFCVLKYGKELKGSFTTNLANELIKPIQEHNIKFHCYTDDPRGLDPRFEIHPLLEEDIKKHIHWNMFKFFNPNFINAEEHDQTIYMDIDMLWNQNPSPMIDHIVDKNELIAIHRHWQNLDTLDKCELHDSFIKFNSWDLADLGKIYFSDPEHWQQHYYETGQCSIPRYGVQNFIWEQTTKLATHRITYLPSEWVFKSHIDKHTLYAEQYELKTGRDYYTDFDNAILHYPT